MAKTGALDLASGLGGKIDKKEVLSAVEHLPGMRSIMYAVSRKSGKLTALTWRTNIMILRLAFMNLVGESLSICSQDQFGLWRCAKGCQRFLHQNERGQCSTFITGLNNNEFQISRGTELNCLAGVDKSCNFVKAEIVIGDGLSDIRTTKQCLEALKLAGCEVVWEKDLAVDSPLPWYLPLDTSHFSLSSFRSTAVGRFITKNMVKALEFLGLAPEGSQRVSSFLEKAADGFVEGGRKEIFTPKYIFLARKPNTDADHSSLDAGESS